MAEAAKDTIYIDVDDDITGIIDKVAQSKKGIVALVLPKRAAVLQSIVNMKLLKRSGDSHKKKLVLITSEAGLLPLAGAVKLHVAKTLQTKPTIPSAPDVPSHDVSVEDNQAELDDEDEDELEAEDPKDKNLDKAVAVGALAAAAHKKPESSQQFQETIDMGDITDDAPSAKDSKKGKKKGAAAAGASKFKIPNFEKFRTKVFLVSGGIILLIIGWYFANFILPTAKITVITDNVSVNAEVPFTVDTEATALDEEKAVVPGVQKEVTKTDAEKVSATGKKNVGEKATGTVSLKLTDCSQAQVTVPSGTTVSSDGVNFLTQVEITFNSVKIGNKCQNDNFPSFTTGTVKVVAQNPGDQYNISGGRKFSVSGVGNVSGYDSSAMTGGTSREVTVVSQQDVDSAKEKLTDKSKDAASSELKKQLEGAELFAITDSLSNTSPAVVASPTVGAEASEVTVTSTTKYTMLGVKREDLKKLVVKEAEKQIDTSKQKISNDGLDKAVFKVTDRPTASSTAITVQTVVSTGVQEDQDALKKELTNKKKGDVQQIMNSRPGVKETQVSFSPFWVYKTPRNPDKITLIYQQSASGDSN